MDLDALRGMRVSLRRIDRRVICFRATGNRKPTQQESANQLLMRTHSDHNHHGRSCGTVPFHNVENGILAEPKAMADFAI